MLFEQFIEIAKKEALKSPLKHKYGAVLIYKNKVISKGYNFFKKSLSSNVNQYVL